MSTAPVTINVADEVSAQLEAEALREWERIAVERAMDYGAALYVNSPPKLGELHGAMKRVRQAEDRLREHLRAHPDGVKGGGDA